MNWKKLLTLLGATILAVAAAADFTVVENGTPRCRILISPMAPLPVLHGAEELATFIEKVTSARIAIDTAERPKMQYIRLGTIADQALVKHAKIDPAQLRPDGFTITVNDQEVCVIGADPRGALYGAYHLLKKYAGVRFLFPGTDGTYYSRKKNLVIPDQMTLVNPSFPYRRIHFGNEITGAEWMARNQLVGTRNSRRVEDRFTALGIVYTATAGNAHILTDLMGKTPDERAELFRQHPEYFPLIDGRRQLINNASDPNPCISNVALLDLMAENLYAKLHTEHGAGDYITIGNNDTTKWCQCDNCAKLDDPAAAGTRGARSDRYWFMVNEVAKRIWFKDPTIRLGGWAYQDFWYPPGKILIDPKLRVVISFNNQCWKHPIGAENCPVNQELVSIMEAWRKTGVKFIVNREEIAAAGTVGANFLPAEKVWYENCRHYPELGFAGSSLCVNSPFAAADPVKAQEKYYRYAAMWQTGYLAAQFLWDAEQDFDKLYEEINSLYYGKAWAGGYREFRQLLEKCFQASPDCMGYGIRAPLGRCLDTVGVEQKLLALLDQAELAAQSDPDPRALRHLREAREIFSRTWLAARRDYLDQLREISVYRSVSPLKIDGKLDENAWRYADALPSEDARFSGRFTYDENHLYLGVEMLDAIKSWEIILVYPDVSEKQLHFTVNASSKSSEASQVAVAGGEDARKLEIAIPASASGQKFYPGATWKIQIRTSQGGETGFRQLKLALDRPTGFQSGQDNSAWKNAEFAIAVPDESLKSHYRYSRSESWHFNDDRRLVPRNWTISADASGSWQPDFVQLTGGAISQYFLSPGKAKLRIVFRARGNGEATLRTCSYTDRPERNAKGYLQIKGSEKRRTFALSDQWQTYTLETETCGVPGERVSIRFAVAPGSQLDLDNVYVDPTPR